MSASMSTALPSAWLLHSPFDVVRALNAQQLPNGRLVMPFVVRSSSAASSAVLRSACAGNFKPKNVAGTMFSCTHLSGRSIPRFA